MQKKALAAGFAFLLCAVAYLILPSPKVLAASCSGSDIAFGRQANCGWFHDKYAASGNPLFAGGMGSVETPAELISFIKGKCDDGGSDETSAAVIVMDMLGYDAPTTGGCNNSSMLNTWASYVTYYGDDSCSGDICTGPSGSIHFNEEQNYFCGEVDTYLSDINGTYDVAPYLLTSSTDPACGTSADEAIVFYNTNGNQIFLIRRACGNILRAIGHLTAPPFNLIPSVTKSVSTGQTVAVPGDTIKFTFAVQNTGDGESDKTTCTEYANEFSGNHATPGGPNYDKGGTTTTLCSGKIFGADSKTTLTTETINVTVADVNHTVCRTLYVSPASYTVSSRGAEACVYISTYDLIPTVSDTSTGPSNAFAEVGDKLTFVYTVDNTQPGPSHPATCTEYANNTTGYHAAPAPPAYDTGGTQSTLCSAKVFTGDQSVTLKTETITVTTAMADTTVCRTLTVTPSSPTLTIMGSEVCVPIVDMPYTDVFGGDVSAGNGEASAACTPASDDYDAGIASWNQNSGLYSGAGTQLAAFAVSQIIDFAAAQTESGTTNGKAPSGLAFANTSTAPANGIYGGSIDGSGAYTLPCINDDYSVPGSTTDLSSNTAHPDTIDLSTLASGAYYYNGIGTLTLYDDTTSGMTGRVQLFVNNQNVYIPSSIDYLGSSTNTAWASVTDIPMLELVDNGGNVYVSNNATELDGTYVAQSTNAKGQGNNGGQIATCATAGGPQPTGAGAGSTLEQNCNKQLVVNGAFVADAVDLERSVNTLSDSTPDSPANLSSSAAEQFDYNPSVWMVQPPTHPGALTYNSIVDLPPVL